MSEDKFDAIIVGGGIAGTVAAYLLAKENMQVLLIERGNYAGSKNMTGGRIYAHSLEKIMPDFAREAPVERKITRERVCLMTEESSVGLDFYSELLGAPGSDSYSVLRGPFDQWLAHKAEQAGAEIITGICVDNLIVRNGKVCGVVAGEDELESDVTILADGINSLLAQKLGMREEFKPHQMAAGIKELIELPAGVIEDRFQCNTNEGASYLFAGNPSNGRIGGGFLYTNKNSISLGIVCTLSDLVQGDKSAPQMMEDFKHHPAIVPLIKGGKLIEYSGHLVPEGGLSMMPEIIGDGVLIVGDGAGFCINLGYAVRGMDLAVASAECAAKTVLAAKKAEDYSEGFLQHYKVLLEDSFVLKDLKLYSKLPRLMESTPRLFSEYPRMAADMMAEMFTMNGKPAQPLLKNILKHMRKIGLMQILKDGWKGVRSL
ncbi:MAG: FAD-dependent oxidoreductase [Smithellaceae bacterium]